MTKMRSPTPAAKSRSDTASLSTLDGALLRPKPGAAAAVRRQRLVGRKTQSGPRSSSMGSIPSCQGTAASSAARPDPTTTIASTPSGAARTPYPASAGDAAAIGERGSLNGTAAGGPATARAGVWPTSTTASGAPTAACCGPSTTTASTCLATCPRGPRSVRNAGSGPRKMGGASCIGCFWRIQTSVVRRTTMTTTGSRSCCLVTATLLLVRTTCPLSGRNLVTREETRAALLCPSPAQLPLQWTRAV